jgi:hypothetical protein
MAANDDLDDGGAADNALENSSADRRQLLRLAGLGVAAVVTIRPAIAQAATSVLTCQIPVPDAGRAGSYIAADGSVVPTGTAGAFPGAATPLKGEDVKAALQGRSIPGTDPAQSQAWTNYIRRLQRGQSGFTCYASLQMPGR